MFRMTHDIIVEGVNGDKPFKASSMTWRRSVDNFSDHAIIRLPALTRLRIVGEGYGASVQTGLLFKEGMKVTIRAGYDDNNTERFTGFIRRVNFSVPLELECEGYSYQLRKKSYTKSWKKGWRLRSLLEDLIQGTDITLSADTAETTIDTNAPFDNFRGVDVLDWLKDKGRLTVNFKGRELYAGLDEIPLPGEAKFRLGWNTVKDSELKFNTDKEFAELRFELEANRKKDGTKSKTIRDSKYTDTKVERLYLDYDESFRKKLAASRQKKFQNRGYEGSLTAFLQPHVLPGMTAIIDDMRYPDRSGRYFVDAVEGEFSRSGGRQKVKLGHVL